MTGKYTPLEKYLSDLPESTREITLNFGQIERILNDTLPPSAYCHQAWWANNVRGSHVEAHAWLNAGWKVESFDQKKSVGKVSESMIKCVSVVAWVEALRGRMSEAGRQVDGLFDRLLAQSFGTK